MENIKLPEVVLLDTISNIVANLGTTKDKRAHTQIIDRKFSQSELEDMYINDWISGKIIDIPADDATRKWRQMNSNDLEADQLKVVEDYEQMLCVQEKFNEAMKWGRLYGGALIVMVIEGQDMTTPLDVNTIREGSLKNLVVVDRHETSTYLINVYDIFSPNFREPEFYMLEGGAKIHYSRILKFEGVKLPRRKKQNYNYWGAPILQRVYDAIINGQGSANAINSIIYEASVDVIGVQGLMEKLSTPGNSNKVMNRFIQADRLKSINNMLLLDKQNEEYKKVQTSFSGLPDLLVKFLNIVAGAADIPATRLLGQSAQGLNATGEGDIKNYYDMVESQQEKELRPKLQLLDEVLVRSALGAMPKDFSFKFNSLWQISELEQADIELKRSQRDTAYINAAVLTPDIIAKQLQSDDTYQSITDEYVDALEEITFGKTEEMQENNQELEETDENNEEQTPEDETE